MSFGGLSTGTHSQEEHANSPRQNKEGAWLTAIHHR